MDTRMANDFYDLLGVTREADASEIKRAYRKKARELHPDVSDASDAEDQFRRVTEAYEVLSDDERRATYDRYGEAGLKNGGWEPQFANFGSIADIFGAFFGADDPFGRGGGATVGTRGEDVHVAVQLDFRESVLGAERELEFTALGPCGTCDGSGGATPEAVVTCETCGGAGAVRQLSRSIFGQVVQERPCPRCAGRGTTISDPCTTCSGTGEQPEERSVSIAIPAGIQDGQRIRLTGRGGSGRQGATAGNLYVDVQVAADERFVREGDDLITVLDLTIADATLGTRIEVPTVDGDPREIEIAAGTQPGTRMVIRGLGSGRLRGGGVGADGSIDRGDLIIYCNVRVPRELGPEQRDALERFRALEDERIYRDKEGIFDRLRRMVKPT
ncbi:MAG: chaperone protein DnaJ [Thermoleophilia bacterium]|nr:chaperone protein DnaJ [Thermoleophilia bacterium]